VVSSGISSISKKGISHAQINRRNIHSKKDIKKYMVIAKKIGITINISIPRI
jgi:hypothetical protein